VNGVTGAGTRPLRSRDFFGTVVMRVLLGAPT
jgi:hypothetical protein